MPEKHLFEYAVMRVVPRVEREEFLNIGVVLYSRPLKFLGVRYKIDDNRLRMLCPTLDLTMLQQNLLSFEQISKASKDGGPISRLDIASRFRWLTATRSTIIQTSKVHPGFCTNPVEELDSLYEKFVE